VNKNFYIIVHYIMVEKFVRQLR